MISVAHVTSFSHFHRRALHQILVLSCFGMRNRIRDNFHVTYHLHFDAIYDTTSFFTQNSSRENVNMPTLAAVVFV